MDNQPMSQDPIPGRRTGTGKDSATEIEAFCISCDSPIHKGEGRYWWEPNSYKCEQCGDGNFNPKWEW